MPHEDAEASPAAPQNQRTKVGSVEPLEVRFDRLTVLLEETVEAEDSPTVAPVYSAYRSSSALMPSAVSVASAAHRRSHASSPMRMRKPRPMSPATSAATARTSIEPGSV